MTVEEVAEELRVSKVQSLPDCASELNAELTAEQGYLTVAGTW